MPRQTTKEQLLKDIETERRLLEKTLSGLNKRDMIRRGVVEDWSTKDVLAHLAAWEQFFLDWYRTGLSGETPAVSPQFNRTRMDEMNREIFERNRRRALDDVLAEFATSYQLTLQTVYAIPETDLFARNRFAWVGQGTLAGYVAANTCNHYRWARNLIRKWLAVRAKS